MTSFMLHQATEYFIKTIPLVFALYGHKEHDLEFLIEKCKIYTMELAKVFPRDTPEEKRLFELLRSAYVEARYTDDFVVTKEDIEGWLDKALADPCAPCNPRTASRDDVRELYLEAL